MPQRDGKSTKEVVHLGNLTLSGVTPASSAWVDTREADAVTLIPISNTITDAGTAAGFSFVMEESDTTAAADATAVDDDQIIGTESDLTVTSNAADDSIPGGLGYVGSKRYVRLTVTGTTGTNADVTVIAVSEKLATAPRTFVGTSVAAT
jgi:hypothetical protein